MGEYISLYFPNHPAVHHRKPWVCVRKLSFQPMVQRCYIRLFTLKICMNHIHQSNFIRAKFTRRTRNWWRATRKCWIFAKFVVVVVAHIVVTSYDIEDLEIHMHFYVPVTFLFCNGTHTLIFLRRCPILYCIQSKKKLTCLKISFDVAYKCKTNPRRNKPRTQIRPTQRQWILSRHLLYL